MNAVTQAILAYFLTRDFVIISLYSTLFTIAKYLSQEIITRW